jgi:hypothetical protein
MLDPTDLLIEPELYLRGGRVIGSIADAIALLREPASRPGIDTRDEVLHFLEHAQTDSEQQRAAEAFLAWAKKLDLLIAPPRVARRQTKS